jgi:hypothetical protein
MMKEKFPKSNPEEILRLIGYFSYYRFVNLAIVTPDEFDIGVGEITPLVRQNLVFVSLISYTPIQIFFFFFFFFSLNCCLNSLCQISKVLQKLFNFTTFGKLDELYPLNKWILKQKQQYFNFPSVSQ